MLKTIKKFMTKEEYRFYKKGVALSVFDAFLNAMVYSLLFLSLMNVISSTMTMEKVLIYSVVAVAVSAIRFFTTNKSYMIMQMEGAESIAGFRIKIGDHIRKLNMGFFNKNNIGELTSTMTNDITDYETFLTNVFPNFIKVAVLDIYLMILLVIFFPGLGWIHAGILLLNIPVAFVAAKTIGKVGRKSKVVRGNMISKIIEYAKGIELFKSYHLIGSRFEKLSESLMELKRQSIRLEFSGIPFVSLMLIIINVSLPLMLLFAVDSFLAGNRDQENLIIYLILALAVTTSVKNTAALWLEISYFTIGLNRLRETMELEPIAFQREEFHPKNSDICFEDVHFSYVDNKPILKNIGFQVNTGERVAIVGLSGSGKSTVLNLIARFWDPDQGVIKIGGEDTREVFPDALLERISMVFQDVYLINDTVMENIRVGNKEATEEEVYHAAKIAHAHEFITALPQGYHTLLSEAGGNISGGEKQRISIARALLKDADIILLDEATASLDIDNESKIQEALQTLTRGKTQLVIAHRLNTIKNADKIIVIDDGIVSEAGSHDQLMCNQGQYYRMYIKLERANEWSI